MIIIYLQMGGGKIKGIKWLFYFSFLLKMITFAVYFYPLLHRDGTVQILQNLLVRIIYHGIVQRIQVNKRSPFAAVSHPRKIGSANVKDRGTAHDKL